MLEWKNLGDICEIKTGRGITQKDCSDSGTYPVISGGVLPLGMYHTYNREANTVTISRVGDAGIVSFITERFYLNDKCFSIIPKKNDDINTRFLYFYLKSIELEIKKLKSKGGVPTINTQKLSKLDIPIPSFSEQSRIVSILDTFTDSIDNLKQQIEQRRKQYEHYRDQLLDLEGKEGVEKKTLDKVSDIFGEYGLSVPSKPYDGVRYLRITDITDSGSLNNDCVSADIKEDINKEPLIDGDLLFARTGATVGKTLLYKTEYGECLFAGYLIRYRFKKDIVNPRYVFHYTHSSKYFSWVKSSLAIGAQPNISAQRYNSLTIPIPSLEEQSRIVSILDTFEASIANLEEQLKLREKQYEYYRNKLLTFE